MNSELYRGGFKRVDYIEHDNIYIYIFFLTYARPWHDCHQSMTGSPIEFRNRVKVHDNIWIRLKIFQCFKK